MQIIAEPRQMQQLAEEARRAGKSIGCVPTMGALHDGHLSLIRRSRAENDLVVMTLFVNPIQFDRKDDLDRYPRDLDRDTRLAGEAGVDIIYSPGVNEMYPDGYATYVTMEGLADRWKAPPAPAISGALPRSAPSSSPRVGPIGPISGRRITSSRWWCGGWWPISTWASRSWSCPRCARPTGWR